MSTQSNGNTMTSIEHGVSDKTRGVVTPLNLHFAALAVLVLVNLYILIHVGITWQAKRSSDADALDAQRVLLQQAKTAATPLAGLDAKLADATGDADTFYARRLPGTVSDVFGELGALARAKGVKLTRGQYTYAPVMVGTAGALTEIKMDASLSGDYRLLVQLINTLERDKMFFVIDGVLLTGQQSGTVNLRLRLTSYLRGGMPAAGGATGDQDSTPAALGGKG